MLGRKSLTAELIHSMLNGQSSHPIPPDLPLCVKSILPVEAVNWKKRNELVRSAFTWIDRHGRPGEVYRFDVIGVLVLGERVRIRHVENAFLVHRGA